MGFILTSGHFLTAGIVFEKNTHLALKSPADGLWQIER